MIQPWEARQGLAKVPNKFYLKRSRKSTLVWWSLVGKEGREKGRREVGKDEREEGEGGKRKE